MKRSLQARWAIEGGSKEREGGNSAHIAGKPQSSLLQVIVGTRNLPEFKEQ